MKKLMSQSLTSYFVTGISLFSSGIALLATVAASTPTDRERGEGVANTFESLALWFGIALLAMGIAMLAWSYVRYRRGQSAHTSARSAEATPALAPPTEASQVRPAYGRSTESSASDG